VGLASFRETTFALFFASLLFLPRKRL